MADFEVDPEDAENELNEAVSAVAEGQRKWPGMSYEEGVANALSWVLGDREEKPYTEED